MANTIDQKGEKIFVSLSTKSLEKVFAWCEINEKDPLSEAYMAACGVVGCFDYYKVCDRITQSWHGETDVMKKGYGWWHRQVREASALAFKSRDAIGRIILNLIKRENSA